MTPDRGNPDDGLPFWLTHPFDWWWSYGKVTTYWLRVGPVRFPYWRTTGPPYELRRRMK